MEILVLKNQLLSEQKSKETLENSLTGEIDYLREQLGLMRSVQTQLEEESSRKTSLEVALQQAKEQLADLKNRASESVSSKVFFQIGCVTIHNVLIFLFVGKIGK